MSVFLFLKMFFLTFRRYALCPSNTTFDYISIASPYYRIKDLLAWQRPHGPGLNYTIKDYERDTFQAFRDIACSQAEGRMVEEAKKTARGIKVPKYRAEAFCLIAEVQAKRGEISEEEKTISEMEDSVEKAQAWVSLALAVKK